MKFLRFFLNLIRLNLSLKFSDSFWGSLKSTTMKIFVFALSFVIATCVAQDWTQYPGAAVVDISAKGDELWVVNKNGNIYRWAGTKWEMKPGNVGKAVRVGASPDGWTWIVNSADEIFRWNPYDEFWEKMPGALVQVNANSKYGGKCLIAALNDDIENIFIIFQIVHFKLLEYLVTVAFICGRIVHGRNRLEPLPGPLWVMAMNVGWLTVHKTFSVGILPPRFGIECQAWLLMLMFKIRAVLLLPLRIIQSGYGKTTTGKSKQEAEQDRQ